MLALRGVGFRAAARELRENPEPITQDHSEARSVALTVIPRSRFHEIVSRVCSALSSAS